MYRQPSPHRLAVTLTFLLGGLLLAAAGWALEKRLAPPKEPSFQHMTVTPGAFLRLLSRAMLWFGLLAAAFSGFFYWTLS